MSDARELLAMRNALQSWLEPHEVRTVAWNALTNAAADAAARGWTGDELARWCIGDLAGGSPVSVGAMMLATLRRLAVTDPPREVTPGPRSFDALRAELDQAANAARTVDHRAWAERIRQRA